MCVCVCMCVYVCMTCSTRGLRLGAPAEQEMLLNRHARMSFCRWNVESATARAALKSCDQGLDSTKTRCTMPTRRSECRSARGSAPFRFPLLIESRSNTSVVREAWYDPGTLLFSSLLRTRSRALDPALFPRGPLSLHPRNTYVRRHESSMEVKSSWKGCANFE